MTSQFYPIHLVLVPSNTLWDVDDWINSPNQIGTIATRQLTLKAAIQNQPEHLFHKEKPPVPFLGSCYNVETLPRHACVRYLYFLFSVSLLPAKEIKSQTFFGASKNTSFRHQSRNLCTFLANSAYHTKWFVPRNAMNLHNFTFSMAQDDNGFFKYILHDYVMWQKKILQWVALFWQHIKFSPTTPPSWPTPRPPAI